MSDKGAKAKAVILVGGEGTRLRPLTYEMPKPMVPVLNRPFLEHTLAYLKHYGVDDIVLAACYLPQAITRYFGDGGGVGVSLSYVVEESPLGTGGAIKNLASHLDDTFVAMNGDIFSDIDIGEMLKLHRESGAKVTIALTWVADPCAFGVVETEPDGRIRRFVEKPSPDKVTSNWINAGIYVMEPEVLEHIPPDTFHMVEKGLFPCLLELGEPIYGYRSEGYWLDMGTPLKYLCLNADLLEGGEAKSFVIGDIAPGEVCCAADAVLHPAAGVRGPTVIGAGCTVSGGAVIKGPAVIGPDCRIGEGASIERAILWQGVCVGGGAVIRECVIGSGVEVEDNARIEGRVITVKGGESPLIRQG